LHPKIEEVNPVFEEFTIAEAISLVRTLAILDVKESCLDYGHRNAVSIRVTESHPNRT
jgi:hypothetical protein